MERAAHFLPRGRDAYAAGTVSLADVADDSAPLLPFRYCRNGGP
jgi:hypothetical protein